MAKRNCHGGGLVYSLGWPFMWHVVLPWFGFLRKRLLRPGPWGELLGVLYQHLLWRALHRYILCRQNRCGDPSHSTAYLGGWWLAILITLSVFSPSFEHSRSQVTHRGLIFITLLVGTMKYWIDGYHPPPPPTESDLEPQQEGFDDRSA